MNGESIGCVMSSRVGPNEFFITYLGPQAAFSPEVGDDLADQVQAAADGCPVSAIEVR